MSNLTDEIMIPAQTNEENKDRLSELPDCIILHILSFLNAIYAVQTRVLSKRWKDLWKHIPALILHYPSEHSDSAAPHSCAGGKKRYEDFMFSILTLPEASTALEALDFDRPSSSSEPHLLKMIADYVVKHRLQLLRLRMSIKGESYFIMPCIYLCQALTSLELAFYPKDRYSFGGTEFPRTLNLPALTTLDLTCFVFSDDNKDCVDPFSAFPRLTSLILRFCKVFDESQILIISSSTVVNLTIQDTSGLGTRIELSAPSLSTVTIIGDLYQNLCGNTLSSVKQLDLDLDIIPGAFSLVEQPHDTASILLNWLPDLHNIKSLIVTANTLQVLSYAPDLLKRKIPSLCNLKSLKVKLKPLSGGVRCVFKAAKLRYKTKEEAFLIRRGLKAAWEPLETIPDGVVDFLLQNSPEAHVEIVGWT